MMKQLQTNDQPIMIQSDDKNKKIITILVIAAIFLIFCEIYLVLKLK